MSQVELVKERGTEKGEKMNWNSNFIATTESKWDYILNLEICLHFF